MRLRAHLTFPQSLVSEPIIYRLGKEFAVVTSIRRANVEEGIGWVILDLIGEAAEIERAREWVEQQGIQVDVIERAEDTEPRTAE
ncbi:MAG: NIL domain-containing protein [Actinomycetota bacterium]|nr:NIL domain-containing protein [Actinomycetota bacterium]